MKRIAHALYHRSPRWLQRLVGNTRGLIWKRQIPTFLQARRQVPSRTRPVSVVIPSYNDLPLLKQCLASLALTLQPEDEIIVVDDYCHEANSAELLALESNQVRVILKSERGGFAKTVNRGMAEARHDIILLNSDIVALPGWVEYLQDAADSAPGVGLVSAKLLYPDGRIQYGGTFWARSFAPQWFAHRFGGAKFNFPASNVRRYNWGAGGACMYVTRAAYAQLGGLDEEYWLGFEDVDYAMSAWNAGFSSLYEPDAVLFHHESATRGFHQGNRELGSMRTFWRKWRSLHDERHIDAQKVRVVVSHDEDALWSEYAAALSEALGAPIVRPEEIGGDFDGVSLVLSQSAFNTVWRSHVRAGIAIAVPSDIPSRASSDVVMFQPEFDYIVKNSRDQARLEAGIGWPAIALSAPYSNAHTDDFGATRNLELLVVSNEQTAQLKDQVLSALPSARVLESPTAAELVGTVRSASPRVVLNLQGWTNELEAFTVLASGAAVISPEDDSLQWLLQNGLNSFTVPLTFEAIEERLSGMLASEMERQQLVHNAAVTTAHHRSDSLVQLQNAIALAVSKRSRPKAQ